MRMLSLVKTTIAPGIQVVGDVGEVGERGGCLVLRGAVALAEQVQAGHGGVCPGEEPNEVGVRGDQDPVVGGLGRIQASWSGWPPGPMSLTWVTSCPARASDGVRQVLRHWSSRSLTPWCAGGPVVP